MRSIHASGTAFVLLVFAISFVPRPRSAGADGDNLPPIAEAGSSRYAATDPVRLDGSASFDPDKSGPLTYTWRQIAGPSVILTGADTTAPTISGFVQTNDIQECEFELVVSDGKLTSLPSPVEVVIVPDFGPAILQQENPPFDPSKPTVIYFGGGDCRIGRGGSWSWYGSGWSSKANIINFPQGYEPDSTAGERTYYKYGDMIIAYLSAVAPNYRQPIQTVGWSTGGDPAIDVGIRLNRIYRDTRYAINHVTQLDGGCRIGNEGWDVYQNSVELFLTSSVGGEQCWIDHYYGTAGQAYENGPENAILFVSLGLDHIDVQDWYWNSLKGTNMNNFNTGVSGGAYWSVIGQGKNLQLSPKTNTYYFRWYGNVWNGVMEFFLQSLYPGSLPEPVTLVTWADSSFQDDDPNGVFLTCLESENAVGYQLLSGSDPHDVAHYRVMTDSNAPPIVRLTALPLEDNWWTIKARDAYGSTIYADPMRIDSQSGPNTFLIRFVDFNRDKRVDMIDFCKLAQHWFENEPSVDVAPLPEGDGIVDAHDLLFLSECWLLEGKDHGLVAHWRFDETEGGTAKDNARNRAGILHGEPIWHPIGGRVNGALRLDGVDDYVSTPFVLNPATPEPFSIFVWVKEGAPGQVIVSQTGGTNWLSTDPTSGWLMTELKSTGRLANFLISQKVVTDGDWHHVGLVREGDNIILYVDDVEVAKDTKAGLAGSNGGLYIGAGKGLNLGSFWTGLIDDVRIYNQAITP